MMIVLLSQALCEWLELKMGVSLIIVGLIMIVSGFLSIFVVIPRRDLHPEIALRQVRYSFYASFLLMIFGLILVFLGLLCGQMG